MLRTLSDLSLLLLALSLIVLVILQAKGNSASAFLNREAATTYRTRRGIDRTILYGTIVIAFIFCLLSLFSSLMTRWGY